MNRVNIRRLKKEDAQDICRIYESIIRRPVKADFESLIQKHAKNEQDACFVAETDGRVAGFMISYILTLGFGLEQSAWIAILGVDPEHWGQEIGVRMASEVFKFYKECGITKVYTSVRWNAPDLLSFFKTLGFDRSEFINLQKDLS